jgi:hypothetical protein
VAAPRAKARLKPWAVLRGVEQEEKDANPLLLQKARASRIARP